jgi:hypothetical protein
MDVKKILLVIAFVFLFGLTCQQILATWPCPCYTISCTDDQIHFKACLPNNAHWIFYYKPVNVEEWQHVTLVRKTEVHDCPENCYYYGTDVDWDCDVPFEWHVSNGEGGTIVLDATGDPCQ